MLGKILVCLVVGALGALPAVADMRGQIVCNVPSDEAVALTAKTSAGAWTGWTTAGALLNSADSEEGVLAVIRRVAAPGTAVYVCDVEIQVNFRTRPARFYRLGRPLQKGGSLPGGDVVAGENERAELDRRNRKSQRCTRPRRPRRLCLGGVVKWFPQYQLRLLRCCKKHLHSPGFRSTVPP